MSTPAAKTSPPPDDDLKAGEREAGFEVAMTNESDNDQFDANDRVGPGERACGRWR